MAFLDEVKKRPGFENCATEADVLTHIAALQSKAVKADAFENTIKELRGKLDAQQTAAHTAFLNQAKAEGKITEEQIPTYLNLMKADEENTRKLIDGMKQTKQMTAEQFLNYGGDPNADPMLKMSFDELDKADKLAEFQQKYPQRFEQMYNEKFGLK